MARSLPKVCPFLVTIDLKLKWPELPRPTLLNKRGVCVLQTLLVYHLCINVNFSSNHRTGTWGGMVDWTVRTMEF